MDPGSSYHSVLPSWLRASIFKVTSRPNTAVGASIPGEKRKERKAKEAHLTESTP